MSNIVNIARALNGYKSGTGYLCKCPMHEDKNPSLSITENSEGKILVNCFAGCDSNDIIEYLKQRDLWPAPKQLDSQKHLRPIDEIWNDARSFSGPLESASGRYLTNRGLAQNESLASIRHHNCLRYYEGNSYAGDFPALVGGCFDQDNKLTGLTRIYLSPEGKKAPVHQPKKMLGKVSTGVMLGEMSEKVGIGEGIETCLAVRQATKLPVIAALSATNLEKFEFPKMVKTVHIFGDRDASGAGQNAAIKLAMRLHSLGIEVYVHIPQFDLHDKSKIDWLDVLNDIGAHEIEKTLAETASYSPELGNLNSNDLSPVGLPLKSLKALFEQPPETESWVVNDLLPTRGLSILVAKPKVGKTTLARQLALSVARGDDFLGRECKSGPVIILALEEKEQEIRQRFCDLGATGDENIHVYAEIAPHKVLDELEKTILHWKPELVIIDPLFRCVRVKEGNNYAEVTNALEPLVRMARQLGPHILCVHHAKKGRSEGTEAILGSQAIFAAFDTAIIIQQRGDDRYLSTEQRYGKNLSSTKLVFDEQTRCASFGAIESVHENMRVQTEILDFLKSAQSPQLEKTIEESVRGKTQKVRIALREAVRNGKITRTGKGGKGDPYRYQFTHDLGFKERGNNNVTECNALSEILNACSDVPSPLDSNAEREHESTETPSWSVDDIPLPPEEF